MELNRTFGTAAIRIPLEVRLLCLGLMLVMSSGCASLKADLPFAYTPPLRVGKPIEGKAVFQHIEDVRSKADRRSTREIPDCADKLTSKLVEDFGGTRLFSDVDYSPDPSEADFIITGKLERFSWNVFWVPTYFIPLVQFIHFFGVPVASFTGEAQLTLEVSAAETAVPVGRYTGTGRNKTIHNMYELKAAEGGVELQYALREAVKEIKEQIAKDPALRTETGQGN